MTRNSAEVDDYGYQVPRKLIVIPVTDASGDVIAHSPYFTGFIDSIQYIKDDYSAGVDFDLQLVDSDGEVIAELWDEDNVNASEIQRPTYLNNNPAGGAAYATDHILHRKVLAVQDRIKITIAEGGDAKSGKFVIRVY